MNTANYEILDDSEIEIEIPGCAIPPLVIRDLGPWDQHVTITNDAEDVVADLLRTGALRRGQRLFYFDSEGSLDEILVNERGFAGFRPGPREGGD